MTDGEYGDLRVLLAHQVHVIEHVAHVIVDRVDVHPGALALSVTNCNAQSIHFKAPSIGKRTFN